MLCKAERIAERGGNSCCLLLLLGLTCNAFALLMKLCLALALGLIPSLIGLTQPASKRPALAWRELGQLSCLSP